MLEVAFIICLSLNLLTYDILIYCTCGFRIKYIQCLENANCIHVCRFFYYYLGSERKPNGSHSKKHDNYNFINWKWILHLLLYKKIFYFKFFLLCVISYIFAAQRKKDRLLNDVLVHCMVMHLTWFSVLFVFSVILYLQDNFNTSVFFFFTAHLWLLNSK